MWKLWFFFFFFRKEIIGVAFVNAHWSKIICVYIILSKACLGELHVDTHWKETKFLWNLPVCSLRAIIFSEYANSYRTKLTKCVVILTEFTFHASYTEKQCRFWGNWSENYSSHEVKIINTKQKYLVKFVNHYSQVNYIYI